MIASPGSTSTACSERFDRLGELAGPLVAPAEREPDVDVVGHQVGAALEREEGFFVAGQLAERFAHQIAGPAVAVDQRAAALERAERMLPSCRARDSPRLLRSPVAVVVGCETRVILSSIASPGNAQFVPLSNCTRLCGGTQMIFCGKSSARLRIHSVALPTQTSPHDPVDRPGRLCRRTGDSGAGEASLNGRRETRRLPACRTAQSACIGRLPPAVPAVRLGRWHFSSKAPNAAWCFGHTCVGQISPARSSFGDNFPPIFAGITAARSRVR